MISQKLFSSWKSVFEVRAELGIIEQLKGSTCPFLSASGSDCTKVYHTSASTTLTGTYWMWSAC